MKLKRPKPKSIFGSGCTIQANINATMQNDPIAVNVNLTGKRNQYKTKNTGNLTK